MTETLSSSRDLVPRERAGASSGASPLEITSASTAAPGRKLPSTSTRDCTPSPRTAVLATEESSGVYTASSVRLKVTLVRSSSGHAPV